MSFLTSFIFFFSAGWPAESEADFGLATEGLSSARALGVLVGVLFVRGLAILVSFLSSLSRRFVLPRRVFQSVHPVSVPLCPYASCALSNRLRFWHSPHRSNCLPPKPRTPSRRPFRAASLG